MDIDFTCLRKPNKHLSQRIRKKIKEKRAHRTKFRNGKKQNFRKNCVTRQNFKNVIECGDFDENYEDRDNISKPCQKSCYCDEKHEDLVKETFGKCQVQVVFVCDQHITHTAHTNKTKKYYTIKRKSLHLKISNKNSSIKVDFDNNYCNETKWCWKLNIGDKVDCLDTDLKMPKWYPAHVIAIANGEDTFNNHIHIRYDGYGARFDVWLHRDSCRLAPPNTHTPATEWAESGDYSYLHWDTNKKNDADCCDSSDLCDDTHSYQYDLKRKFNCTSYSTRQWKKRFDTYDKKYDKGDNKLLPPMNHFGQALIGYLLSIYMGKRKNYEHYHSQIKNGLFDYKHETCSYDINSINDSIEGWFDQMSIENNNNYLSNSIYSSLVLEYLFDSTDSSDSSNSNNNIRNQYKNTSWIEVNFSCMVSNPTLWNEILRYKNNEMKKNCALKECDYDIDNDNVEINIFKKYKNHERQYSFSHLYLIRKLFSSQQGQKMLKQCRIRYLG